MSTNAITSGTSSIFPQRRRRMVIHSYPRDDGKMRWIAEDDEDRYNGVGNDPFEAIVNLCDVLLLRIKNLEKHIDGK